MVDEEYGKVSLPPTVKAPTFVELALERKPFVEVRKVVVAYGILANCVFGSNQNSSVVVALDPIGTMSVALFG